MLFILAYTGMGFIRTIPFDISNVVSFNFTISRGRIFAQKPQMMYLRGAYIRANVFLFLKIVNGVISMVINKCIYTSAKYAKLNGSTVTLKVIF